MVFPKLIYFDCFFYLGLAVLIYNHAICVG